MSHLPQGGNCPLISVLVPVYNAEGTLERCVNSVLAQTWRNLELILVDDGSTDKSAAMCNAYTTADKRVRVVRQKNKGSAAARNTALAYATGAYIAWVDADDYVFPEFLTFLHSLAKQYDAPISMCRFQSLPDGPSPAVPAVRAEDDCVMDFEAYGQALHSIRELEMIALWNKLYEAWLWRDLRFPEDSSVDDAWVVWRLVYGTGRIAVSTWPLYVYYQTPQSITRGAGAFTRLAHGVASLQDRYIFLLQNGHPHLAAQTLCRYYDNLAGIWVGVGGEAGAKPLRKQMMAAYRRYLWVFLRVRALGRRMRLRLLAAAVWPGRYMPAVSGWLTAHTFRVL